MFVSLLTFKISFLKFELPQPDSCSDALLKSLGGLVSSESIRFLLLSILVVRFLEGDVNNAHFGVILLLKGDILDVPEVLGINGFDREKEIFSGL